MKRTAEVFNHIFAVGQQYRKLSNSESRTTVLLLQTELLVYEGFPPLLLLRRFFSCK